MTYDGSYHVGLDVQHDTVDFKKIRTQVVCDSKEMDSVFYLRADAMRNFVGAGCDNKLKDGIQHSWEGIYCWKDNY